MESKVNNENYILIQGWMVNELGLKGNELIVYAIIYGFTQAENQKYSGKLQYLADWCCSTKQGIIRALKLLEQKGLIIKEEKFVGSVKYCEYHSTKFNGGIKQSLTGIKQSLTVNNIDNNNIIIKDIVDYLNEKAKAKYKANTPNTVKHITARLKDGYSFEDFKHVIDTKCLEWLGDNKMEQYLRPDTLFGAKFESYLNQKRTPTNKSAVVGHDYSEEKLNGLFDNLNDIEI